MEVNSIARSWGSVATHGEYIERSGFRAFGCTQYVVDGSLSIVVVHYPDHVVISMLESSLSMQMQVILEDEHRSIVFEPW